jgi:hypothetical protein
VHVYLFPSSHPIRIHPSCGLLPMTFVSQFVSPRAHGLPPNTSLWHTVIIHGLEPPLEISGWHTMIIHGIEPPLVISGWHVASPHVYVLLLETFVSHVATLPTLSLPINLSTHCAKKKKICAETNLGGGYATFLISPSILWHNIYPCSNSILCLRLSPARQLPHPSFDSRAVLQTPCCIVGSYLPSSSISRDNPL